MVGEIKGFRKRQLFRVYVKRMRFDMGNPRALRVKLVVGNSLSLRAGSARQQSACSMLNVSVCGSLSGSRDHAKKRECCH
jgi:hypothetical protein